MVCTGLAGTQTDGEGPIRPARRDRRVTLLVLQMVFQWVLYLQAGWDQVAGTWSVFNPDTYATLTIARTWAHAHPLRLLPNQPPGTILSDLLSPLFYSVGCWLGFRDTSSFVLWSYIVCLLVSVGASLALLRFFERFAPEVAFPAAALCMAFPGIYVNIFATNFGFLFLFFWVALASLHSLPRFMLFAVLAALMRPESVLTYGLLVALYAGVNGRRRLGWCLLGLLPSAVPPMVYRHLTGGLFPQGVVPQNVLRYHGLFEGIGTALPIAADQIKGGLLGFFSSRAGIGVQDAAWIGSLPPPVFLLGTYALYKKHRPWLAPAAIYLLVLIVADSFTVFAGLHYNRHLHTLTPLFFGFALGAVRDILGRRRRLFAAATGLLGIAVALQFVATLSVNRRSVRGLARDKLVVDFLLRHFPRHTVIDSRGRLLYWADSRLNLVELSPATDAELGRHVKYYWRVTEIGEAAQRFCAGPVILFSEDGAQDVVTRWLMTMRRGEIAAFVARYSDTVRLSLLDLSRACDSPPHPAPYAELDVGDFLSEHRCGYSHHDSLDAPLGAFLLEGDGFMDGGRPGVTRESFELPVPEGGGVLVARLRGDYQGRTLRILNSQPGGLSLRESPFMVTAGRDTVFNETVTTGPGFAHVAIPVLAPGMTRFTTTGFFNSFHYWVYPADVSGFLPQMTLEHHD